MNQLTHSKVSASYLPNQLFKRSIALLLLGSTALALLLSGQAVLAAAPAGSLGATAENVIESLSAVAKLITAASYVLGFGFVLGAIFKFKAHKDNPQQIPVGTPIALLFIGAAMIFLPQITTIAGKTIFSDDAQTGTVSGVDTVPGYE